MSSLVSPESILWAVVFIAGLMATLGAFINAQLRGTLFGLFWMAVAALMIYMVH